MLDIAIIGAGISGLTLALRAQQANLKFVVLEESPRPGGVIQSVPGLRGLQENGPDALVARPAVLELLEQLGLTGQTVQPAQNTPWIARQGKLHPLPDGFRLIAPSRWLPFAMTPLLSWMGKLRVLGDLILPPGKWQEPTLAEFVTYRLGKEVLDQLAQPLIGGIYAADPQFLSMNSAMPHLLALEKEHGSLIRGLWKSKAAPPPMISLQGGLGQIVQTLEQRLAGHIQADSQVRALNYDGQTWTLLGPGQSWQARRVVLATPAQESLRLLATFDPNLTAAQPVQVCRSVAVLNLLYRRQQIPSDKAGRGFLVPLKEGGCFSALSLVNHKWPGRTQAGFTQLRVHLGGAGREHHLDLDDNSLVTLALSDLQKWLGVGVHNPDSANLSRHALKMPELRQGHRNRVEQLEKSLPKSLQISGNWLAGIGIADCIGRANALASHWSPKSETENLCKA